ncbi:MAG TPA: hypothetical protein VGM79_29620 [Streptosporangiaceae bacterium]|jgi:3-oxoacyl-(acyl-carrier-protein) synthase
MSALLTREGTHASATQPTTAASRGRLRGALHQIRLAIGEINYASHRVVEVQAPWTVDKQWYSK